MNFSTKDPESDSEPQKRGDDAAMQKQNAINNDSGKNDELRKGNGQKPPKGKKKKGTVKVMDTVKAYLKNGQPGPKDDKNPTKKGQRKPKDDDGPGTSSKMN